MMEGLGYGMTAFTRGALVQLDMVTTTRRMRHKNAATPSTIPDPLSRAAVSSTVLRPRPRTLTPIGESAAPLPSCDTAAATPPPVKNRKSGAQFGGMSDVNVAASRERHAVHALPATRAAREPVSSPLPVAEAERRGTASPIDEESQELARGATPGDAAAPLGEAPPQTAVGGATLANTPHHEHHLKKKQDKIQSLERERLQAADNARLEVERVEISKERRLQRQFRNRVATYHQIETGLARERQRLNDQRDWYARQGFTRRADPRVVVLEADKMRAPLGSTVRLLPKSLTSDMAALDGFAPPVGITWAAGVPDAIEGRVVGDGRRPEAVRVEFPYAEVSSAQEVVASCLTRVGEKDTPSAPVVLRACGTALVLTKLEVFVEIIGDLAHVTHRSTWSFPEGARPNNAIHGASANNQGLVARPLSAVDEGVSFEEFSGDAPTPLGKESPASTLVDDDFRSACGDGGGSSSPATAATPPPTPPALASPPPQHHQQHQIPKRQHGPHRLAALSNELIALIPIPHNATLLGLSADVGAAKIRSVVVAETDFDSQHEIASRQRDQRLHQRRARSLRSPGSVGTSFEVPNGSAVGAAGASDGSAAAAPAVASPATGTPSPQPTSASAPLKDGVWHDEFHCAGGTSLQHSLVFPLKDAAPGDRVTLEVRYSLDGVLAYRHGVAHPVPVFSFEVPCRLSESYLPSNKSFDSLAQFHVIVGGLAHKAVALHSRPLTRATKGTIFSGVRPMYTPYLKQGPWTNFDPVVHFAIEKTDETNVTVYLETNPSAPRADTFLIVVQPPAVAVENGFRRLSCFFVHLDDFSVAREVEDAVATVRALVSQLVLSDSFVVVCFKAGVLWRMHFGHAHGQHQHQQQQQHSHQLPAQQFVALSSIGAAATSTSSVVASEAAAAFVASVGGVALPATSHLAPAAASASRRESTVFTPEPSAAGATGVPIINSRGAWLPCEDVAHAVAAGVHCLTPARQVFTPSVGGSAANQKAAAALHAELQRDVVREFIYIGASELTRTQQEGVVTSRQQAGAATVRFHTCYSGSEHSTTGLMWSGLAARTRGIFCAAPSSAENARLQMMLAFASRLTRPIATDFEVTFGQAVNIEFFGGVGDLYSNVPLVIRGRIECNSVSDSSENLTLVGKMPKGRVLKRRQLCAKVSLPLTRLLQPRLLRQTLSFRYVNVLERPGSTLVDLGDAIDEAVRYGVPLPLAADLRALAMRTRESSSSTHGPLVSPFAASKRQSVVGLLQLRESFQTSSTQLSESDGGAPATTTAGGIIAGEVRAGVPIGSACCCTYQLKTHDYAAVPFPPFFAFPSPGLMPSGGTKTWCESALRRLGREMIPCGSFVRVAPPLPSGSSTEASPGSLPPSGATLTASNVISSPTRVSPTALGLPPTSGGKQPNDSKRHDTKAAEAGEATDFVVWLTRKVEAYDAAVNVLVDEEFDNRSRVESGEWDENLALLHGFHEQRITVAFAAVRLATALAEVEEDARKGRNELVAAEVAARQFMMDSTKDLQTIVERVNVFSREERRRLAYDEEASRHSLLSDYQRMIVVIQIVVGGGGATSLAGVQVVMDTIEYFIADERTVEFLSCILCVWSDRPARAEVIGLQGGLYQVKRLLQLHSRSEAIVAWLLPTIVNFAQIRTNHGKLESSNVALEVMRALAFHNVSVDVQTKGIQCLATLANLTQNFRQSIILSPHGLAFVLKTFSRFLDDLGFALHVFDFFRIVAKEATSHRQLAEHALRTMSTFVLLRHRGNTRLLVQYFRIVAQLTSSRTLRMLLVQSGLPAAVLGWALRSSTAPANVVQEAISCLERMAGNTGDYPAAALSFALRQSLDSRIRAAESAAADSALIERMVRLLSRLTLAHTLHDSVACDDLLLSMWKSPRSLVLRSAVSGNCGALESPFYGAVFHGVLSMAGMSDEVFTRSFSRTDLVQFLTIAEAPVAFDSAGELYSPVSPVFNQTSAFQPADRPPRSTERSDADAGRLAVQQQTTTTSTELVMTTSATVTTTASRVDLWELFRAVLATQLQDVLANSFASHPRMVRCLGFSIVDDVHSTIFELPPGPSLAHQLSIARRKRQPVPWSAWFDVAFLMFDVAAAFHAGNTVHGELLLSNIFADTTATNPTPSTTDVAALPDDSESKARAWDSLSERAVGSLSGWDLAVGPASPVTRDIVALFPSAGQQRMHDVNDLRALASRSPQDELVAVIWMLADFLNYGTPVGDSAASVVEMLPPTVACTVFARILSPSPGSGNNSDASREELKLMSAAELRDFIAKSALSSECRSLLSSTIPLSGRNPS